MTGVSQALAGFVAETPASAIPDLVRRNAIDTMIDAYGTAHAGLREPTPTTIREALLPMAGPGSSVVLGVPDRRTDPASAALFNATASHSLDYDAISFAVSGFVGSAELFALAALADTGSFPGADVVTAYCLGWEAAAALARAVIPEHYAIGWHPTSTMGLFAATFAACRLLGLDRERTLAAMSVATSEASGIKIMIGNMVNAYHVGKASRNGVNAALLARAGFVGHPDPIESAQGFFALFQGPSGASPQQVLDTLGTRWDLADPGPVLKIYACCGLVHSGLDAVIALRDEERIDPAEVRQVEVLVHEYVPKVMHVAEPDTGYAAKFCIPYCIAAGLRDGRAGLAPFRTVDTELVELGRRVTVGVHPELHGGDAFFEKEFTEVRLTTGRGTFVRRANRLNNRGTGSLGRAELLDKFTECMRAFDADADADAEAEFERLCGCDTTDDWKLWST